MVADQLAKKGHNYNNSCVWFSHFPLDVLAKVYFDLYDLRIPTGSNF